jgi:S-adenosyl-L-methionine hydrolase (adenosine-forming)
MSIITLLTDFGLDDEYVGVMKGVILSVNPAVAIVDITHRIDNQDIVQAAFTIHSAYRFFPDGTVHLVVVDPDVGMERAIIAAEIHRQFFIAPDNGVLSLMVADATVWPMVRVTNARYFLSPVSRTFHGRDKIAPVGAHVSKGIQLKALGPEIGRADVVCLEGLQAEVSENGEIIGRIVAIDHFGNLITNIDTARLTQAQRNDPAKTIQVKIGCRIIRGLSETYAGVAQNTPLALIGSREYLEIAVNRGNARRFFNAQKDDPVQVMV